MINSGGFNIYPSDIEAVLARHPAVVEAAVAGVPAQRGGDTPVAFVVPAEGQTVTPEALRQWLNGEVGANQRVSAIEVVQALPRSPIGKVLKRELRDAWIERHGSQT